MKSSKRRCAWVMAVPIAVAGAAHGEESAAPVDDDALAIDAAAVPAIQRVMYQNLAKHLIDDGKVEQAQQVLQLLKERELAPEIASPTKGMEVTSDAKPGIIGLSYLDQRTFAQYYALREQQAAIGQERDDLERKRRLGQITAAENKRLDYITTRLFPEINGPLSRFFALLQDQISRERSAGQPVPDLAQTGSRMRSAVMELQRAAPAAHAVGLQYLWNDGDLTIILVTAGAPPIVRQVPIERREFIERIHTARELLRLPQSDPARVEAALIALRALVIAPIQSDLQAAGAHTLMILPDDFLRAIPFAALSDGKRYLIQDYALTLFSDAVSAATGAPADIAWKVAGMGSTRAVDGLPALPAVSDELGMILKQPGISGTRYLDDQFNRDQLTRSLEGDFNVLHIASHFILQPGHPEASRLYLGDRSQLTLADVKGQDLRFDNFDLVTFSACETGLGGGVGEYGQDLEGLAAEVQAQGAHAVMASLWKVYDASTAQFMQDFYRARSEKKLSKAESLRAAQLAFIDGSEPSAQAGVFKRPYYWAPFVLMGNWQ